MPEIVNIPDLEAPLAAAANGSTSILEAIYSGIPWEIIMVAYSVIFIDLFYGVIVSTVLKEAISHKMLKGLKNKMFVLFVPIFGIMIKMFFILCSLPAEWTGSSAITSIFGVSQLSQFPVCFLLCLFIILMEFLSFLETSAKFDKRAQRLHGLISAKGEKHKDVKKIIMDDEDSVLSH